MALLRKIFVLILLLLAIAGGARAASEARTMLPESIKALEPGRVRAVQPLRREHLDREIEFQVALRMRDFPKLLARMATGEVIPQAEMAERYLPLPANYAAVVDWAKREGLTITQTDPMRLGLFLKGTVSQVQTATRAQFAEVTVAEGTFTSAVTAPSIPATLGATVLGLNGLQPHIHPHHIQSAQPQTANAPPYLVKEILGAYGASNLGYNGSGETIAILIDTFPQTSDLTSFWSHNNIPQSMSNVVEVQAVSGALDAISGEETLDSEWTTGVASGAKIRIYATKDLYFVDLDKGLQRILSDLPNQPSMHELSISLGLAETEVSSSQKNTDAQYFANIANYGVSIFVSSGDDGAEPGQNNGDTALQPSYYSSDPSVTGAGGTSLYLYSSGAVQAETAWNGSGGGISSYFARPSWQVGAGVPSGSKRLVPDVASAADPNTGAYIYYQGLAKQIGGTSWSAPTWAGLCAIINQARTQNGMGPMGLLNPRIYPLQGTGAFRDITSGNNGGYSAGAGYDLVTGLGTPVMSALLPALTGGGNTTPAISSFTPAAGPVGTNVTISGVNFERVASVEFNGIVATTSTINSANSIVATVPAGATTGPIEVLTGSTSSASAVNFSVVPLPTNDNFANATLISGTAGQVTGGNLAATREPGEPEIAGNAGGASVWWEWTAPSNATYTFSTAGSSFDTIEGVFTGSAVNALTTIASNDDYGTSVTSSVTFAATAGTVYHIAVDGYAGASGAITLTWEENAGTPVISNFTPQSGTPGTVITVVGADLVGTSGVTIGGVAAPDFNVFNDTQMTVMVPATAVTGPIAITGALGTTVSSANFVVVQPVSNDNFANAAPLSGASGTVTANNAGATREPGEPEIAGNPGGKSIWYTWVPSSTGPVTFTTFGSSFDTLLGVYTGNNVTALTLVASNDDYGNTVTSSVTFLANAGIVYHIAVDGFNGASGNVVLNWSKDSALPVITGFSPNSGPPATTLEISGSNFTGVNSVSLGTSPLSYTVVSNTEINAVVPVGATTGLISVGNLLGAVKSANSFTVTAGPSNDDFANSIQLGNATEHVTGANVGATREAGEPEIAGNPGGASVWWSWTAPSSGVYAISTQGSSFDTLLGVYTGDAVNALTEVASNDDDPTGGVTSYVTIDATKGTVYRIAVDGLNGASGSISLSIYPQQASTGLYSTGFEVKQGFTAGLPLAGQDGWLTYGTGGNGIKVAEDGMSGQQAYVGQTPPVGTDGGVFAYHPVDYAPVGSSEPIVTFSVKLAINDSSNGFYDDFQWQLYNSKSHNFFTIDFFNGDLSVYYLQDGSSTYVNTGVQFSDNTTMNLVVTMDYAHNRWSATLDGAPLVTNKAIRVGTAVLDFGDMDAVWQIDSPGSPGDNYMVFDDYSVVAGQDPMPRITFQPQSQSVVQGNAVTLGVVASGQAPLYYQWMLNKKALAGAQGSSLTIPDAEAINAGSYTVSVSNAVGLVTSLPAKLTVTPQPMVPMITRNPASITVAAGSTAVFQAAASGYPAPTYQWMFKGSPIPGAKSATLKVAKAQVANEGDYSMVATNTLGSGTSTAATLTVGNSFSSQKGNFNGMIYSGPTNGTLSELLKVTMGASGSFTGSVILGGTNYRLAGSFNAEGAWQGTVGRTSAGLPVTVNLQLALSGTNEITGSILAGGATETVTALRDNYSKTGRVAPESPVYTMTLKGASAGLPDGVGYASIKVDQSGNVRAAGRLGDATAFSFSSAVTDSGAWPFYASLYKSMGYIGGMLTFEGTGQPMLGGTLNWVRPFDGKTGGYSAFQGNVIAAGYIYTPPAKGMAVISLNNQNQGSITFSGTVLSSAVPPQGISLGPTNSIVVDEKGLSLTVQLATGVFSGTVSVLPGLPKQSYYGVLLQPLDAGSGLFETPTVSGEVEITSP